MKYCKSIPTKPLDTTTMELEFDIKHVKRYELLKQEALKYNQEIPELKTLISEGLINILYEISEEVRAISSRSTLSRN